MVIEGNWYLFKIITIEGEVCKLESTHHLVPIGIETTGVFESGKLISTQV